MRQFFLTFICLLLPLAVFANVALPLTLLSFIPMVYALFFVIIVETVSISKLAGLPIVPIFIRCIVVNVISTAIGYPLLIMQLVFNHGYTCGTGFETLGEIVVTAIFGLVGSACGQESLYYLDITIVINFTIITVIAFFISVFVEYGLFKFFRGEKNKFYVPLRLFYKVHLLSYGLVVLPVALGLYLTRVL